MSQSLLKKSQPPLEPQKTAFILLFFVIYSNGNENRREKNPKRIEIEKTGSLRWKSGALSLNKFLGEHS